MSQAAQSSLEAQEVKWQNSFYVFNKLALRSFCHYKNQPEPFKKRMERKAIHFDYKLAQNVCIPLISEHVTICAFETYLDKEPLNSTVLQVI